MAGKSNERLRRSTRTLTTLALVVFLLLLAGELAGVFSGTRQRVVDRLQWIILGVFVAQLVTDFFLASSKKAFLKDNWFNIIALIPAIRVLRAARALRVGKLVRIRRGAWGERAERTLKAIRRTFKHTLNSR